MKYSIFSLFSLGYSMESVSSIHKKNTFLKKEWNSFRDKSNSKDENNSSSSLSSEEGDFKDYSPQNEMNLQKNHRKRKTNIKNTQQQELSSQEKACKKMTFIVSIIVLLLVGCLIGYLLYYYQDNKTDVPQEKSMENKG